MAALVCDLCGGKLVMGAGGIAICDSCGMEHSADRMQEKVQEIKGTVRVDNTHMIENYLEMARNAYDAGNNIESESYCNKIIEIDPTNYKAWFLKGKAAGWQSTIQNPRVSESILAFTKAIMNVSEEDKNELIEQAKEQIVNLSKAMISLRGQNFAKWPDEEGKNGLVSDIDSILNILVQFSSQTGVVISVNEVMASIAIIIDDSVIQAYNDTISPDYCGDPDDSDDRADKYEWQRYIERIGHCITLLEVAIDLCEEDYENDIRRYEDLIYFQKQAIDSCSWDYRYNDWGDKIWRKEWRLSYEAKSLRKNLIHDYELKIKEIKEKEKEEAEKRFDEYWLKHADEKVVLETEKASLQKQIISLEAEISNIPGNAEKENFQKRINTLSAEKDSLGIFKRKEKKAIQKKMDEANLELKKVVDKIEPIQKEIEKKIEPLQNRINEINTELTKER